jgi:hypothetical protein
MSMSEADAMGKAGKPGPSGTRRTEIVGLTDDHGDDADIYVTRLRYNAADADTVEIEGIGHLRAFTIDEAVRLHAALSNVLRGAR